MASLSASGLQVETLFAVPGGPPAQRAGAAGRGATRICEICKTSFWCDVDRGQQFCSRMCYGARRRQIAAAKTERVCTSCLVTKPVEDFHRNKLKGDGCQAMCKRCKRLHLVQRVYGLDPAAYQALWLAQGGVCAICRRDCTTHENLSVDHCHETGRVRGLLCFACNRGLAAFGDTAEGVRRALEYLA